MRRLLIVAAKELTDSLRDRRTLGASLVSALLFPLLLLGANLFMVDRDENAALQGVDLPVEGARLAPNLVASLRAAHIRVLEAPADVVQAVRENRIAMALRIGPAYVEAWNADRPAPIELVYDSSRISAQAALRRVRETLQRHAQEASALRLRLRGIGAEVVTPLAMLDHDLVAPQTRGAWLLAMLPFTLTFSLFIGGLYVAIDSTAGERERQSLEALLLTASPRAALLLGKIAATAVFSLATLLLSLSAFQLGMLAAPVSSSGLSVSMSLEQAAALALVFAPIAPMAAAAELLAASVARSYREAQNYLQFLLLVPLLPNIALMVRPLAPEPWMIAVPLLGQCALADQIVRGVSPTAGSWAGSAAIALGVAAALAALAIHLQKRQQQRSGV